MSKIKSIVDTLERIGTIGSPSSTTELSLDILGAAVTKKLVGELALFDFIQDGKEHTALGQITDIELRNAWLEDPTMRSLARQRGQVNPVSGQQDTHLGQMNVSAVFAEEDGRYQPSILGMFRQQGLLSNLPTMLLSTHYLNNIRMKSSILETFTVQNHFYRCGLSILIKIQKNMPEVLARRTI